MATLLNKRISRETAANDGNGRNLIVTLDPDGDKISFKPKGRTAKAIVSLPIETIYRLVKNAQ